jgi:NAD(P)-dependent dehydrogenase (short-subunit alcohol dehydrogenase family)
LAGRKQDAILAQYGEGHMLLAGKVAVITGGGRGIGRAIARKFAGEGAAAVVAARTQSEIEAVAKEIRDAGGRAAAVPTDVAEQEHCEHLIQTCEAQFGRIDILVNNAGDYGPVKPVEEINPPEWDRVIAEHLRGAYLLTRLVLPGMYARGSGTILNISSLSAKSAFAWSSPYAAAKAGILGLTRVVAAEAARKGVRVNAICPGPVTETKMSKDLGEALAKRMGVTPGEQLAGFLKTVLQGRGQTTDEIAAAALFLCSEHASAITGQALNVDGGTAFY